MIFIMWFMNLFAKGMFSRESCNFDASVLPGGIDSQPAGLVLLLRWSKTVHVWIYFTITAYLTRTGFEHSDFMQSNPIATIMPFLM